MPVKNSASFHLPTALSVTCSVLLAGSVFAQSSPYVQSYTYNKKGQLQTTTQVQPQTQKAAPAADKTSSTSTTTTATTSTTQATTTDSSKSSGTDTTTTKTSTTKTSTTSTGTKAPAKPIIIDQSAKDFVSQGPKWQTFSDYIDVKPGQEALPMTLTVRNGTQGTTPFRAIRATLGGKTLFTEGKFTNNTLQLDMSGALTPGPTQIVFTAWGNAGSTFNWQLSSSTRPEITGLSAAKASPGDKVKANGKNLPTDLKQYAIKVDGSNATVKSATGQAVEFEIPDKLKAGKGKPVEIKVSGVKAKPFTITIAVKPEIKGFNYVAVSGNQVLTISGTNFGTDASDVKVTFNGASGTIQSVSDNVINVVTPEFGVSPGTLEVKVTVGGLDADKPGRLLSSMRCIPNDDGYSPYEIPNHLR